MAPSGMRQQARRSSLIDNIVSGKPLEHENEAISGLWSNNRWSLAILL